MLETSVSKHMLENRGICSAFPLNSIKLRWSLSANAHPTTHTYCIYTHEHTPLPRPLVQGTGRLIFKIYIYFCRIRLGIRQTPFFVGSSQNEKKLRRRPFLFVAYHARRMQGDKKKSMCCSLMLSRVPHQN